MPKPESQAPKPSMAESEGMSKPSSPGQQRATVARLDLGERRIRLLENGGQIVAVNGKPVGSARRQHTQK